jgi:predicted ribonuclease YlaK
MKFYDTCVLLDYGEEIFKKGEKFFISNITLQEIENIKNSRLKDDDTKYKARVLGKLLLDNPDLYEVIIYKKVYLSNFDLYEENNDLKIIACAFLGTGEDVIFVTSDIACYHIATSLFSLNVEFYQEKDDDNYLGYIIKELDYEELATFYDSILIQNENKYNLLINQYLLIKSDGAIIDKYKWTIDGYKKVNYQKPISKMLGGNNFKYDDIQQLGLDSLASNQITMLRGPAGSGKSCLAFNHMFSLLEKGTIDKIIVFCNTVATRGSAKLGFYPGSRTEKLLDSQIGNLLISKLGDRLAVEKLIDDGQLILLPFSDIRGYDTTGMNAAIYISEAQNLDIELMKLALQRIGNDSICIIDGDDRTQVDLSMYAGKLNGMKRTSQVFRNHTFYGEVTLNKIHRSAIAELAQEM